LTSKIINMAEKLKDAEDRLLEAMFRPEILADDGFSKRVVAKIRRRLWVRRLALPIAMLIGGGIAAKPLVQLALAANQLLAVMPRDLLTFPTDWIPHIQLIIIGAMLLVAGSLAIRTLED